MSSEFSESVSQRFCLSLLPFCKFVNAINAAIDPTLLLLLFVVRFYILETVLYILPKLHLTLRQGQQGRALVAAASGRCCEWRDVILVLLQGNKGTVRQ